MNLHRNNPSISKKTLQIGRLFQTSQVGVKFSTNRRAGVIHLLLLRRPLFELETGRVGVIIKPEFFCGPNNEKKPTNQSPDPHPIKWTGGVLRNHNLYLFALSRPKTDDTGGKLQMSRKEPGLCYTFGNAISTIISFLTPSVCS